MTSPILGIWDGHDAGAAVVAGSKVISAINEERLTRRKLEVGFPEKSVVAVLAAAGVAPQEVEHVAVSTTDLAKTLTRVVPRLKEQYYLLRRKKLLPGLLYPLKKMAKYRLTEVPSSAATRWISRRHISGQLKSLNIGKAQLSLVDHHAAHAATAAFTSGFPSAAVVTLDGIGDGLSGSIWHFRENQLTPVAELPGGSSFGIFFEHVANIMNLRELEDEGKVMALANYAYPVSDDENPLLSFFKVDGLNIQAAYSSTRMHRELRKVFWRYPLEQFAFMAQRTLEVRVLELIRGALGRLGERRLAYAGGLASNIKINMLLRELPELDRLFVFPHMGDGGQALGAAMWANYQQHAVSHYDLSDLYWGPSYTSAQIRRAVDEHPELEARQVDNAPGLAAELITRGEIIFWFQGRMEYGPRALGGRSILARADSLEVKDALNLKLKKRVWYQPFCPSMLDDAARESLVNYDNDRNPFMTCGYRVRPPLRAQIQGAMSVDGTCRPQILTGDEDTPYAELLKALRAKIGQGIVLNTSLNLHGEPMVCSPEDVVRTFLRTDVNYLIAEDLLISKRPSTSAASTGAAHG